MLAVLKESHIFKPSTNKVFVYRYIFVEKNREKVYSNSLFNKNTKQNVRIIQLRNVLLTEWWSWYTTLIRNNRNKGIQEGSNELIQNNREQQRSGVEEILWLHRWIRAHGRPSYSARIIPYSKSPHDGGRPRFRNSSSPYFSAMISLHPFD